jgi:hypothetical protein
MWDGVDSHHPYLGMKISLRRFTLLGWRRFGSSGAVMSAMRVKGEEPLSSDLKGLASGVREPSCRGHVVLMVYAG